MQLRVNFTDNILITYNLVNHEIVDSWAELIKVRTVNDLCPLNHYVGYTSDELLTNRIHRLYELADYINIHTPERVIKVEITTDNYQEAINTMHVHFPSLKNDINYQHIWGVLTEYNDLIHWIESTIRNRHSMSSESGLFRITLDFNKSGCEFKEIPESAYELFNPDSIFGELKLHYTYVGRHAQELFIANDMTCPQDQFIPQRLYSASVRMHFTDDYHVDTNKWKLFYMMRGKKFWGLDFYDPKLAFGYMKIGQLSKITINNIDVPIPTTTDDRHTFRTKLVNTSIISWEII